VENIHFALKWFYGRKKAMPRQTRLDAPVSLNQRFSQMQEAQPAPEFQDGPGGLGLQVASCFQKVSAGFFTDERESF
jgi:hypothetical protein